MTKEMVVRVLIMALLFCGGCKKSSDPNEIEKTKAENAALKAKVQKLETANTERHKGSELIPKKEINKDATEVVKISKPFFGMYLGEKIGEPIDVLAQRGFVLKPSSTVKDKDDPTKRWYMDIHNPNILTVAIDSFNGYIYCITPIFKDTSEDNFNALKSQLEQTYGKEYDAGLAGIVVGGKSAWFLPTIDGVQVLIGMTYYEEIPALGQKGGLGIGYQHMPLENKVKDEIKRRKLERIKGNL